MFYYSSPVLYLRSCHCTFTALCSTQVAYFIPCPTSTFAKVRFNTNLSRSWPLVPPCYLRTFRSSSSPVLSSHFRIYRLEDIQ